MNCVDAGNVLVHLFLQTPTKYLLTNRKLQYLLIIGQMSRLAGGGRLFDDDIRNFKHGLVLDAVGDKFTVNCAIVDGKNDNRPVTFEAAGILLPYTNRKIYEIKVFPSQEDKDLLVQIFLTFGAFDEATLATMLNAFRPIRKTPLFQVVAQDDIANFLTESMGKNRYPGNLVFEFIKDQNMKCVEPEPEPEPEVAPAEDVAEPEPEETLVAPTVAPLVILKDVSSLAHVVTGKRYSVLVELPAPELRCQVTIVAMQNNQELPVAMEQLGERLWSFSFVGVASDLRISVHQLC